MLAATWGSPLFTGQDTSATNTGDGAAIWTTANPLHDLLNDQQRARCLLDTDRTGGTIYTAYADHARYTTHTTCTRCLTRLKQYAILCLSLAVFGRRPMAEKPPSFLPPAFFLSPGHQRRGDPLHDQQHDRRRWQPLLYRTDYQRGAI